MATLVPHPAADDSPEILLGRRIKAARDQRGKRLVDVSRETGVSVTALSNLENGLRKLAPRRLAHVVEAVGANPDDIFGLAGAAPPQAAAELLGPELRRARESGRLTGDARRALRREHLAALAGEVVARLGTRGTRLRIDTLLLDALHVDLVAGEDWRLINARSAEYPSRQPDYSEPWDEPHGRIRLAHMAAHVLLAAEEGVAPLCSGSRTLEAEADFLGGALLVPRQPLQEQLLHAQGYDLENADQLTSLVTELAEIFDVPTWVAAEQLALSGGLAWAARGRYR